MSPAQEVQELTDLKVMLLKCCIAESDLACFLLDKANSVDLPLDDTFKLKHLADRVKSLITQLQASDDSYHPKDSDDKLPVPVRRVFIVVCYWR
jgi:soluble P-type ATPase